MATNKHTTAKTSYRITNWSAYNKALVARGSLTIWMSQDAMASWQAAHQAGKNGHPFVFSNSCIELLGILRELYRLPLRQTVGFTASLFSLMGVNLPTPDYSTLQRRLRNVTVPIRHGQALPAHGPLVLVVDSTGVKVSGEGLVAQPPPQPCRSSWR